MVQLVIASPSIAPSRDRFAPGQLRISGKEADWRYAVIEFSVFHIPATLAQSWGGRGAEHNNNNYRLSERPDEVAAL